jgi:transposase
MRHLPEILEDAENGLSARFRAALVEMYEQLRQLDARVARYDEQLELIACHGGRVNLLGFVSHREPGNLQRLQGPLDSAGVISTLDEFAEQHKDQGLTLVVLDNAPIHHSHAVYARLDDWLACGVGLHFLPPYSPELNLIEHLWRTLKFEWLPLSAYLSAEALREAVDEIIANYGSKYRLTFA